MTRLYPAVFQRTQEFRVAKGYPNDSRLPLSQEQNGWEMRA
jgi:hypothetical protein